MGDVNVDYFDVLYGPVQLVRLNLLDGEHILCSARDATKDGVLSVEPWDGGGSNEELRTVRVWTGVGH